MMGDIEHNRYQKVSLFSLSYVFTSTQISNFSEGAFRQTSLASQFGPQ